MDFHLDTLCFESRQKPKSFRPFFISKTCHHKGGRCAVSTAPVTFIFVASTGATNWTGDIKVVMPVTLIFGAMRFIAVLALTVTVVPEMVTGPPAEMLMSLGAIMEMEPVEWMVIFRRRSSIFILWRPEVLISIERWRALSLSRIWCPRLVST